MAITCFNGENIPIQNKLVNKQKVVEFTNWKSLYVRLSNQICTLKI